MKFFSGITWEFPTDFGHNLKFSSPLFSCQNPSAVSWHYVRSFWSSRHHINPPNFWLSSVLRKTSHAESTSWFPLLLTFACSVTDYHPHLSSMTSKMVVIEVSEAGNRFSGDNRKTYGSQNPCRRREREAICWNSKETCGMDSTVR